MNVAVVVPAGTSTEAGTAKAEARLLDRDTVVPLAGAVLEIATLQAVEAEAVILVLPHCSDVICGDATSERFVLMLPAFKLAVTDASWSWLKEPAVVLKVVLLALGAIDTVAGTVTVPVEVSVIVVAEATGPLRVTVQLATAAGARDVGVQVRPLSSGLVIVVVVTVPPALLIVIERPSKAAARALETPIVAELAPGTRETVRVATVPLEMRFVLMPLAIQI